MRKSFFLLFVLNCLSAGIVFAQKSKIDSLRNRILEIDARKPGFSHDTDKVNTLVLMSSILQKTGRYDTARIYLDEARAISNRIHYKKGLANVFVYEGGIFFFEGSYANALNDLYAGLPLKEELKDKKGIAYARTFIGLVYWHQKNYSEAIESFSKALQVYLELNEKFGISTIYNNMGLVYLDQGNYPLALQSFQKALIINTQLKDKRRIANADNNIGNVYYLEKNYPDALNFYFSSLKLKEEIDDQSGIANTSNNIGYVYVRQKKFTDAKKFLDDGLALSMKLGEKERIKDSYMGLYSLDSATGNFNSCLKNYKLFIIYRDSLFNEENTKKSVQSQMTYEFDKKQTEDSIRNSELKKQEDLKNEQEVEKQKNYSYGGGIGFLLMLIAAGVSFRAFRNKRKANEIISHQKLLVEEKQKEILDSIHYAKRIQKSLLPTEKYIDRNLNRLRRD